MDDQAMGKRTSMTLRKSLVAVASMNARDDTFKVWKARRHLTESEFILPVLYEFLDGVETKET